MRQAEDPLYASLLSRFRLRVPTDEGIEILRRRSGALLPNMQSVPAIVRRHDMNMRRLHEAETKSDGHIIYCIADITDVTDMSMLEAHQIRFGFTDSEENRPSGQIISPPAYIFVRISGSKVQVGLYPVGVVIRHNFQNSKDFYWGEI
jgi:hypothetical protein